MLFEAVFLILLGIASYTDIKTHKIPHIIMILMLINGVIFVVLNNEFSDIKNIIIRLLIVFIVFFVICRFVKLGIGDAKLFCILILFLNLNEYVVCLLITFIFAAFVSLYIILFKNKGITFSLPIVPFILISYIIHLG